MDWGNWLRQDNPLPNRTAHLTHLLRWMLVIPDPFRPGGYLVGGRLRVLGFGEALAGDPEHHGPEGFGQEIADGADHVRPSTASIALS